MAVNYSKLWHLLIDKNISKTQLIKDAKISTNAMAHLGKNEDVRVEVLVKICETLNCSIEDIMEIVPDDNVVTNKKRSKKSTQSTVYGIFDLVFKKIITR